MKRPFFIAAAVSLLVLIALVAYGQQWTQHARFYVPFEFVVGNAVLPAGEYSVSTATESNSLLMFSNTKTNDRAFAHNIDIGMPANTYNQNTNLVFVLDASGRHVLHQVWLPGQSHGHDVTHEKGLPEPR